jgi:porin
MKLSTIGALALGMWLAAAAARAQDFDGSLTQVVESPGLAPVLEDAPLTSATEASYVHYDEGADFSASDCECGCDALCCRENLFGDWLGARSCLAESGVVADIYMTQFYQGVASGGREQTDKYGGKIDYEFTFVGAKLGLNEGFFAFMHAETQFGESINADAGALALPNLAMLYPLPDRDITSISGFYAIQALSETFAVTAGKYRTVDLIDMLYPDINVGGIDGFMNASMLLPTTIFRTTNLSVNGAGLMLMREKQVQSALMVYDTQNSSTTVAPDLFGDGAVLLGYHRFFTEFGGLAGSHGLLGNWSSRTYASTDPLSWEIIPGEGLVPGQATGSWSLSYIIEQKLWVDCCDASRNVGLFSVLSLADGDPNPYRWSANVSLQASGLVRGRLADTMGVGYFYDGLSSDFKRLVNTLPAVEIDDVQGVELYYNAEMCKWFHLTTDLQVVENQNVADDAALILGLRAKMDF